MLPRSVPRLSQGNIRWQTPQTPREKAKVGNPVALRVVEVERSPPMYGFPKRPPLSAHSIRRRTPQPMEQEIDKAFGRLFPGKAKVPPAMHVSFHQEIGKEIKISRRQHKGRILPAPAGLPLNFLQSRPDKASQPSRHILKDRLKMPVLEFDHIAQQQQKVMMLLIHGGTDSRRQFLETVLGKGIFEIPHRQL